MRKTTPALNDKKKVSPRGKRKLQFIEKQAKLPLSAKSIYLDIKDVRQSRKVEEDLKRLGAVVEKFLSKDINYVISCQARHKQQKDDKFGSADSPAAASTPSPFNCGPSPGNVDTKASQPSTITRGKAMVNKAKVENKVSSIVENAENWGVKVISLQAALKWIKKEISKLPKSAHQEKQETKSQQQSSSKSTRVKRLKPPYLKFDASSQHYKPVFKQLDTWPHAHVETARGTCPFDGLTVGRGERSREERGDRIGIVQIDVDSLAAEVNEDLKDSGTPFGDKSAQGKNKQSENNHSSIVGGVKLVTAGDIRRRQEKKRNAERKRGYCECCQLKYEDLDKHVRDDQHKAFIRDKNNYKNLDDMIQSGPNTAQFLQRLLIQHCAENKTRSRNSASNNESSSIKNEEKSKGKSSKQSDCSSIKDKSISNIQSKNKNKSAEVIKKKVVQASAKSPVKNQEQQAVKSPEKNHQNQSQKISSTRNNDKQELKKSPVKNDQKQTQDTSPTETRQKQPRGRSPIKMTQIQGRSPVKMNPNQVRSPVKMNQNQGRSPVKYQSHVKEGEKLQKQTEKSLKKIDSENANTTLEEVGGPTSMNPQRQEMSPKVGENHTIPQRYRNLDVIMVENMSPRRASWTSKVVNDKNCEVINTPDESRLKKSPRKTKNNDNNGTNFYTWCKNDNSALESKEHLERLFREKIQQAKIPDSPRRTKAKKENLSMPEEVYIGKNKTIVDRIQSPQRKTPSVSILKRSPSISQRREKSKVTQENKEVNLDNYCVEKSPCFKKSPIQKNLVTNSDKMQHHGEMKRQRKVRLFEFDDTDDESKSATSEMQKSITGSPRSGISNTPGSNKRRKRWRVKKSKEENKSKSESKEKLKSLQKFKLPVNEKRNVNQNITDEVQNIKKNSEIYLQKDKQVNIKHSQSKNKTGNNDNVEKCDRGNTFQGKIADKRALLNDVKQTKSLSSGKENTDSVNSGSTKKRNDIEKLETSSEVSISGGGGAIKTCEQLGVETISPPLDMYSRAKLGRRRNKNSSPAIITSDSNFISTKPTHIKKSNVVFAKVTKENNSTIEESINDKNSIQHNEFDRKDSGIGSSKKNVQEDSFSLKWQNASILDSEKKPRKVKLDRSWNLISDRSALKILGSSERDAEESFEGFQPNDVGETELGTDVSFVETTEIELDENSNQEWTIDHESEEVEDLLPTLFSSPGKRSDSSWGDACEDYIQSQLTGFNKYSFRIGPSPVLSPRRRINTTPSKRKIVECEGDETFEITPKKRKFGGRHTFEHNMNYESSIERVDSEITFNHCSPQKGCSNTASPRKEKSASSFKIHTSTPFRLSPSQKSKNFITKHDQIETSKISCDTSNQGRKRSLRSLDINNDHASPVKKSKSRQIRNR